MKRLLPFLGMLALLSASFAAGIALQAEDIGVKSIEVKDAFYENGPVTGKVLVSFPDASRQVEIELVGGEPPQVIASLRETASAEAAFDFGVRAPGQYRIDAFFSADPCYPCRASRHFTVIKRPAEPVPETSALALLAVPVAVLALALYSKKRP